MVQARFLRRNVWFCMLPVLLLVMAAAAAQTQPAAGKAKVDRLVMGLIYPYRDYMRPWIVGTPDRLVPEGVTRLATLLAEEVHISEVDRALQKDAVAKGMQVITSKLPAIQHYWHFGGLHFASPKKLDPKVPFVDRRVRQAMNMVINRNAIGTAAAFTAGLVLCLGGASKNRRSPLRKENTRAASAQEQKGQRLGELVGVSGRPGDGARLWGTCPPCGDRRRSHLSAPRSAASKRGVLDADLHCFGYEQWSAPRPL
jgi:hypothetical protein